MSSSRLGRDVEGHSHLCLSAQAHQEEAGLGNAEAQTEDGAEQKEASPAEPSHPAPVEFCAWSYWRGPRAEKKQGQELYQGKHYSSNLSVLYFSAKAPASP